MTMSHSRWGAGVWRTSAVVVSSAVMAALFGVVATSVEAAVTSVTCPGDSLQAAVTAAGPGDTITVTGTCTEAVVVDKPSNTTLTLIGSVPASAGITAPGFP